MAVKVLEKPNMSTAPAAGKTSVLQDPPLVQNLFGNTRFAWIWLLARFYLGYVWLSSGLGKLSNPVWMSGGALKGFWEKAAAIPDAPAKPAIAFDWYRVFIQSMLDSGAHSWFGPLVAYGEVIIGAALILGLFTGFAAFFGGFMNWNFMMAGAASVNPVMFPVSILLILAWKTAGYIGLDRWLLPLLGAPWQPGSLFRNAQQE